MDEVTVVGGGLAGLVAAVECAERGVPVRVLEARRRLGGRATTTPGPFAANYGAHAFYTGPLWSWLKDRRLHGPARIPTSPALRFRWQGEVRRTPPSALRRGLALLRHEAPGDTSLSEWVRDRGGDEAVATALANFGTPLTFDADPGRVSAAFLAHRIRRILLKLPPVARYVEDGWGGVVGRLEAYARSVGVVIETGSRVDAVDELGPGPVVVAVQPPAARRLFHDESLRVEAPRVLFFDVGLRHRGGDPYVVFDLDDAAFVDRYTAIAPGLAPPGHDLVQAVMGLRPGEDRDTGRRRLEQSFDAAFLGWRERVVWERTAVVTEATGALDLPGQTWEDRPPVAYRPGVWLAGDWVAAPGHLAEVSWASAVQAGRGAAEVMTQARRWVGAP